MLHDCALKKDSNHDESEAKMLKHLSDSLCGLTLVLKAGIEERKKEFDWLKSHAGLATKQDLKEMELRIMASQAEIVASLKESLALQQKTASEIKALQAGQDALTQKIAELQAIIDAGGTIGQELIDAAAAVAAQSKTNDELIPDVVVPPTPTP